MMPAAVIEKYLVGLGCAPESAQTLAEGVLHELRDRGVHFVHSVEWRAWSEEGAFGLQYRGLRGILDDEHVLDARIAVSERQLVAASFDLAHKQCEHVREQWGRSLAAHLAPIPVERRDAVSVADRALGRGPLALPAGEVA